MSFPSSLQFSVNVHEYRLITVKINLFAPKQCHFLQSHMLSWNGLWQKLHDFSPGDVPDQKHIEKTVFIVRLRCDLDAPTVVLGIGDGHHEGF